MILEDVEEDAGLIEQALQKEKVPFTRLRVDTRKEFTTAIGTFNPDVILADHSLPQFNSLEALQIYQEMNLSIPFILVTGAVSEEFAVSCLKKGADDYVLKSNLSRLPMSIRYALRHRTQENMRKQQEETLRKQNEELTKINKELDSFAYCVSHNLRSPLSTVLGLVNLARMDQLKSQEMIDRYFEMIRRSVSKLDETLKEILNYSRNSRTQVDITKVNLEKIIWQSFAETKYLENHHEIKKLVDIQSDTPFYSDAHRLFIIMSNFISNAIKYHDEAKDDSFIRIFATVSPFTATINIQDNGIGVHEDYLPEIFKMFYRATEKSEGAGLGLYIAKEMLEKLGGAVTITSQVNKFTHVMLSIPNQQPSA